MSKILIIEDEADIAELEKDYLEINGFEVEIENKGDTGLAKAKQEAEAKAKAAAERYTFILFSFIRFCFIN